MQNSRGAKRIRTNRRYCPSSRDSLISVLAPIAMTVMQRMMARPSDRGAQSIVGRSRQCCLACRLRTSSGSSCSDEVSLFASAFSSNPIA